MAVGVEEADGESLRRDVQVGEAKGGQGEGLVMLAVDVQTGAATTGDDETGRMLGDLQMLHEMVVSAEVEGHAVLGEEEAPLPDEGLVIPVRAIGKEGMMGGNEGPWRCCGGGELRGEEASLSDLVGLGKAGMVAIENNETYERRAGGGNLHRVPTGGKFPAGAGILARVGELHGQFLLLVIVVAEGNVKGAGEVLGAVHLLKAGLEALWLHLTVKVVTESKYGGGRSRKERGVLLHAAGDGRLIRSAGAEVGKGEEMEAIAGERWSRPSEKAGEGGRRQESGAKEESPLQGVTARKI